MNVSPLAAALLFWTLVYFGACATALIRALRPSARTERGEQGRDLSVLVIRPCAGNEANLAQALRSSPAGTRVAYAVANERDAAFSVAERVAQESGSHLHLTEARGLNQKVQQLAFVISHEAPSDVVIVCDSDVVLREGDIASLIAPMRRDSRVVACWAAPTESLPSGTLGDRISAAILGGSLHAFPLLAAIDPSGMVGKFLAIRRDALEQCGGFAPLAAYLGEDMELARRLRAHGEVVFCGEVLAHSHATGRSVQDALNRFTRWIHVIRAQRLHLLLGYPFVLAAWPLLFSLSVALILWVPEARAFAMVSLFLATVARAMVSWIARRLVHRTEGTWMGDMLLADLALLVAFFRALGSRSVTWRGHTLLLGKGGALQ